MAPSRTTTALRRSSSGSTSWTLMLQSTRGRGARTGRAAGGKGLLGVDVGGGYCSRRRRPSCSLPSERERWSPTSSSPPQPPSSPRQAASMNTPYLLSSALSSTHYAVVQQVENATSAPEVDAVYRRELDRLQHRLEKGKGRVQDVSSALCAPLSVSCPDRAPTMLTSTAGPCSSQADIVESLVLLLYLEQHRSTPVAADAVDFALVPALNLAEGGKTRQSRALGRSLSELASDSTRRADVGPGPLCCCRPRRLPVPRPHAPADQRPLAPPLQQHHQGQRSPCIVPVLSRVLR